MDPRTLGHVAIGATFAALVGCKSERDMQALVVEDDAPQVPETTQLLLDVVPPGGLASADGRTFLPQTFEVTPEEGFLRLDLLTPVVLDGTVTGYAVSPWASTELPGAVVPVEGATVTIERAGTVQSGNDVTRTTDSEDSLHPIGSYELVAVPEADYLLSIVPKDASVPFRSVPYALLEDETLDIDLGVGVALWGLALDAGGLPMRGVSVHAIDQNGVASAPALSDADGVWLLRVEPGEYTVVSTGRADGRDPVLVQSDLVVGDAGLSLDFVYGDTDLATVEGRVVGEDGRPVDAVANFHAIDLDGYPEAPIYDVTAETDGNGNFTARMLGGRYDVEIHPADAESSTPLALGTILVDADEESLGTLQLEPMVEMVGRVVDPEGNSVANAQVTVSEVGFGQRTWTSVSNDNGRFQLDVPTVELDVVIAPPAGIDLPITHTSTDGDALAAMAESDADGAGAPHYAFVSGQSITGAVNAQVEDGNLEPVRFAVVEARDADGNRWGIALTDEAGNFSMQIAFTR